MCELCSTFGKKPIKDPNLLAKVVRLSASIIAIRANADHVSDFLASIMGEEMPERNREIEEAWERTNG